MSTDEIRSARRVGICLAALLIGHALLAYQMRARGIFTAGDDAAYLLLSRALRAFSYREIQFIGEPIAARFPPGYPALLAVLGIAGEHIRLIALAGIALSVSGLYALFDVIRRRWSADLGLLVTAVVAINPSMVVNAGAIATEGIFTALTLWALWAADRSDHGERRSVSAGVFSILAAMTRSAGVTVPLALGAHWLWRRNFRRAALLALGAALTVGAWLTWTMVAPKREFRRSYIDDAVSVRAGDGSLLGTLTTRIKSNVPTYAAQTLPDELALPLTARTKLDNVGWLALLSPLLLVGVVSAWGRWNVAVIWTAGYSMLLVLWSFTLERFLQPMVPVLIALILVGAWMLGARARSRLVGTLPATLLTAFLAAFALVRTAGLSARAAECDRTVVACAPSESLDYVEGAKYIATHTPPDARLIVPKNATLYYYAPRQSVFWDEAIAQDSATFLPFLERNRVTHILTTPIYSDQLTLARLAATHCTRFDLVKAFAPETMILARRSTPSGQETPACRAIVRAAALAEKRERSGDVNDLPAP